MDLNQRFHSGTKNPNPSDRELAHGRLAREMAAEGFVLLKNEGMLPLKDDVPVALFGSGAAKTVKGGIGSGDVNNRENISVYRGLQEAGITITSNNWLADYRNRYVTARNEWKNKILDDAKKVDNPFDAYAVNPFSMPQGRKITEEDLTGAQAVIYVLSRFSGEGKDRTKTAGDYYLSEKEKEDLCYLNQRQIPIALILNVGAPVELTDILQEMQNICAVLHISLPGQEGGRAVADVLYGKITPGGRLTATWAKHYEDYPYADEFSHLNGNLEKEEYREGIYVGYRYFDSFGIQPLFPFGYGLSYTQFLTKCEGIQINDGGFKIRVSVKNIGDTYAAKEVVQVYITMPQTGLEKEFHRLSGFAKTNLLEPHQEQKLTVTVHQKQLAVFSEKIHAWVIEAGKYIVWAGKHLYDLQPAAVLEVAEQVTLEQTNDLCNTTMDLQELCKAEPDQKKAGERISMAEAENIPVIFFEPKAERRKHIEKRVAESRSNALEKELSAQQLIPLLYGNITQGASTLGSAGTRVPGSAGETTEALEESYGVRSLIMADGPAGIRLRQSYEVDKATDTVYGVGVLGSLENGFLEPMEYHKGADVYYQYCTAFPVGTLLAQTWDLELMKRFGRAIAAEMKEFHVDLWLAPGMNIHRNPLCGRNFEYFSEDPYLSGMLAAAVTQGVQEDGRCGVTIKHFACNNQEDNRMGVNVCISERALREIYLRGFEIAVKNHAPAAIMTSYNQINGIHAANSKDLCTTIARNEWGFDGVMMSDWNTTVPKDGSVPWQCVAVGNDVIMPGNGNDEAEIRKAFERGELSEEAVRECAGRVLALVQKMNV